jgi:metallo-beta-lactamase family protein
MIEVQFLGAAHEVTGSKHLVRTSRAAVLLDCGLFQGRRRETFARNRDLPLEPADLDAVVLSHAHVDHSGALPILCGRGFAGPIYATSATVDLCAPMLMDAAMLQESDARHIQRLIERGAELDPVQPLFDQEDVVRALGQLVGLPYHRPQLVAPGITLQFLDAGHVLGSAIVVLDIDDEGRRARLAFTGDLGRRALPILRDPEVPTQVETLIVESTYGDRQHEPIEETGEALAAAIRRTCERGGKVIIPAFALERAQELIYQLKRLRAAGRIPAIPVYVDSPLTVKLTDVFRLHPECYDRETRTLLQESSPFEFEGLRYVSDVEDSKAIDAADHPAIVIAGSGMCEGGRVLHHLRATVGDARNTVIIVGFQAQHTLGRRLVERRPEVRIFGLMNDRRAEVVVLNGFSAHADQRDLVRFVEDVRQKGPLRQVLLVHGEPAAQEALAAQLTERGFPTVSAPAQGERVRL